MENEELRVEVGTVKLEWQKVWEGKWAGRQESGYIENEELRLEVRTIKLVWKSMEGEAGSGAGYGLWVTLVAVGDLFHTYSRYPHMYARSSARMMTCVRLAGPPPAHTSVIA
eukprot:356694-Chlamydomonas_euryale.AAC.7